jgi:hypothetical protein
LRRNAYADRPEDRSDDDAIDCSTRSTVFMLSFDYYLLSFLFVCLLSFGVCCWELVVCCWELEVIHLLSEWCVASHYGSLCTDSFSLLDTLQSWRHARAAASFDIWFCGMHFEIC